MSETITIVEDTVDASSNLPTVVKTVALTAVAVGATVLIVKKVRARRNANDDSDNIAVITDLPKKEK